MSPSIHTSISISLGASSIAHTPCHSISHPCSPITISTGSLCHNHTLSPPHVCIFSTRLSQPLSLVCQTSLGHVLGGLSLSVANNHTLSPHVTPRIRCARCLTVIRRCCHVICLRVAYCHVIICISSACFSKLASVRVLSVLSVVRSESEPLSARPSPLSDLVFMCGC